MEQIAGNAAVKPCVLLRRGLYTLIVDIKAAVTACMWSVAPLAGA